MRFVNFKIDPAAIAAQTDAMAAAFAGSGKPGTFEANAVRVIAERLRRRPEAYVEFGPYWWAVKQVLNDAGADLGSAGDALVASEYRGATDAQTLVAGEMFKDMHRATYFVGHALYDLADDGEQWALFDDDMAQRVPS